MTKTVKRSKHSRVMTIANSLIKQGYSRSMAMVEAWIMVKLPQVITRVAGVTHAKRQTAIEHLQHYNAEDISITLVRDKHNAYDVNAVAVVATVKGKGSYTMGYLPRAMAMFIAPLLNAGKVVTSHYRSVKAKAINLPYGLEIAFTA